MIHLQLFKQSYPTNLVNMEEHLLEFQIPMLQSI